MRAAALSLSLVLSACSPPGELVDLALVPRDAVLRSERGEPVATPVRLGPGTHVFSVERAGFASTAFALTAREGRARARLVQLRPLGQGAPSPGASALVLDGTPAGGAMSIDNHTVNQFPARLPLPPGPHLVAQRCASAPCFSAAVTLAPDTVGTVYAGALPALLSFALEGPAGLAVALLRPDGTERPLGEAPLDTLLERTPSLRLRVRAPGAAARELTLDTRALARLAVYLSAP